MHMHIIMCICMYVCMYVYVCLHVYNYACMCIYMYVYMCVCMFVCIYVLFIYLQKGRMYFSRIKLQKVHGLRRIPLTRAYGFIGVYRNDEIF